MRPALTIRMDNQPGTGAATFRKLADAGVSTDLLLPVRISDNLFFAVICVDDPDKAVSALGEQVVPGANLVSVVQRSAVASTRPAEMASSSRR